MQRCHSPAFPLIVLRDRRSFANLLIARTVKRLRQIRARGFDRGLLLRDLAVERLGLERYQYLAGADAVAFIDVDARYASADQRPDVHRPRLERSGEDERLRLSLFARVQQRRRSRCEQKNDERGPEQNVSFRRQGFSMGEPELPHQRYYS